MKAIILSAVLLTAMGADNKLLNLPPGQYPGSPPENFAPTLIGDSYLILMPGGSKAVTSEVAEADARGGNLAAVVEGFNVAAGR